MSVTRFQDFPLADADRKWERDAAEKRIRKWAGADDEPNRRYRRAYVWYDRDDQQNFGAHKLPVADVIDGKLTAVPRAVIAAAAVVQGARGGIDLPKDEVSRVKSHLAKYYRKMGELPPWERDDG